jgi:Flp pilus assembly protein protease CpaA
VFGLDAFIPFYLPSAILLAGVINDLYSRKYKNWLFLVSIFFTAFAVSALEGPSSLILGLTGVLAALVLALPMTLFKVIGAGDLKLLIAFGFATSWHVSFKVQVLALFWGVVLGVARAALDGQLVAVIRNASNSLIYRVRPPANDLHVIPYTVPIFLAWIAHLMLEKYGVAPW